MAADPILIIATRPRLALARGQAGAIRSAAADYWALTKPEVDLLIAIATFTGFCVAVPGPLRKSRRYRLVHTQFACPLVPRGTGTLNHYVRRRYNSQVILIALRPLASGGHDPSRVFRG